MNKRVKFYLILLIIAVSYFATAWLGLLFQFQNSNATPLWPPSGIAFAAVLLLGRRVWPGIAIGAFAANIFVFLFNNTCDLQTALWVSILIASGNTLEALAGQFLIRKFIPESKHPFFFQKVKNIIWFVYTAGVMSLVSAFIGTTTVYSAGIINEIQYMMAAFTWWTGDLSGILLATPLILSWSVNPKNKWLPEKPVETILLFMAVLIATGIVFDDWFFSRLPFAHAFFVLPFLIWAAYRLKQRAVISLIVTCSIIALWGTVNGNGPLWTIDLHVSLLTVQGFVLIMFITMASLNAGITERSNAMKALQESQTQLNYLLEKRQVELEQTKLSVEEYQHRIDLIEDVLSEFSRMNFSVKAPVSMKGDDLDVVAIGLNNMADELQRKIREKAQSEEKFYKTFHSSPVGMAIARVSDRTYVEVNDSFLRMLGYTRDEVIGHTSIELGMIVNPEIRVTLLNHLNEYGSIRNFELKVYHKSGKTLDTLTSTDTLFIGQELHTISVLQDITEQREIERRAAELLAVKGAEERFQKLIQVAPIALVMLNNNGIISFINHAGENLFGYSSSELIGQKIEKLLPDRYRAIHSSHREGYYRDSTTRMMGMGRDLFALHKSGREFPVEIGLNPIELEEGTMVLSSIVDITERKKAEDKMRMAKEHAEHLAQAKQEFLAVMSHEIRTPLSSVTSITKLLSSEQPKKSQLKYLKQLRFSSRTLMHIVNNILDFSKIESGKLKAETIDFNLRELLTNIFESFVVKAEGKKIGLKLYFDDRIPDILTGDSQILTQILDNLLSNAIKFTSKGEVLMRVLPTADYEKKVKLMFEVIDTGIGIEKHKHLEIFEKFSQESPGIRREFGGTGLGLPISKKLAEIIGGTLTFESEHGKGSTFRVEMSFRKYQDEFEVQTSAPLTPEQKPLQSYSILLAEDNMTNQELTKKFIARWGAEVDCADNGLMAIEKVRLKKYDLILMDLQMPLMDGFEASREIRILGYPVSDLPIIALTAYSTTDEKNKAFESGMNDFITKPIDTKELQQKILKNINDKLAARTEHQEEHLDGDKLSLRELLSTLQDEPDFIRKYLKIYSEEFTGLPNRVMALSIKRDVQALSELIHKTSPSIQRLKDTTLQAQLYKLKDMIINDHQFSEDDLNKVSSEIEASCHGIIEGIRKLQEEYL